jgi:hypothetical protein
MVYKINNKYYIKVQGYYKEVEITSHGDSLDIKPITSADSKIEVTTVNNVDIVDLKTEDFKKDKFEPIEDIKPFKEIKKYKKEM